MIAANKLLYSPSQDTFAELSVGSGLSLAAGVISLGTHTHAATDIVSGSLALARGGSGADLSATGPGFLRQASAGAVVTVAALSSGDLTGALGYTPANKAGDAFTGGTHERLQSVRMVRRDQRRNYHLRRRTGAELSAVFEVPQTLTVRLIVQAKHRLQR